MLVLARQHKKMSEKESLIGWRLRHSASQPRSSSANSTRSGSRPMSAAYARILTSAEQFDKLMAEMESAGKEECEQKNDELASSPCGELDIDKEATLPKSSLFPPLDLQKQDQKLSKQQKLKKQEPSLKSSTQIKIRPKSHSSLAVRRSRLTSAQALLRKKRPATHVPRSSLSASFPSLPGVPSTYRGNSTISSSSDLGKKSSGSTFITQSRPVSHHPPSITNPVDYFSNHNFITALRDTGRDRYRGIIRAGSLSEARMEACREVDKVHSGVQQRITQLSTQIEETQSELSREIQKKNELERTLQESNAHAELLMRKIQTLEASNRRHEEVSYAHEWNKQVMEQFTKTHGFMSPKELYGHVVHLEKLIVEKSGVGGSLLGDVTLADGDSETTARRKKEEADKKLKEEEEKAADSKPSRFRSSNSLQEEIDSLRHANSLLQQNVSFLTDIQDKHEQLSLSVSMLWARLKAQSPLFSPSETSTDLIPNPDDPIDVLGCLEGLISCHQKTLCGNKLRRLSMLSNRIWRTHLRDSEYVKEMTKMEKTHNKGKKDGEDSYKLPDNDPEMVFSRVAGLLDTLQAERLTLESQLSASKTRMKVWEKERRSSMRERKSLEKRVTVLEASLQRALASDTERASERVSKSRYSSKRELQETVSKKNPQK
ncbi:hypothetical protein ADUPG1_013789 [Aduncisulcus paluster]|uniref:Uncharacterized protein n=1 Tax=Aduncisulcus paluster TaxID=2918883 RepID=A0ABQ5K454_9EUKA|nr:hypothetical protein ADUPG1_013789 [Aduncisulcus paluster]